MWFGARWGEVADGNGEKMMRASEITMFRKHLKDDPENLAFRRTFHENYEWLEGYWHSHEEVHSFDRFCQLYGEYYWEQVASVQSFAAEVGTLGPIGSSTRPNYAPTQTVVEATSILTNNDGSSVQKFTAMLLLVRQIRNNLFHGRKMELIKKWGGCVFFMA